MRDPDLPERQGIPVAELSGEVLRSTRGDSEIRNLPQDEKVARLLAISRDPAALGYVLGGLLAPEHPEYAAEDAEAVGLLRAAGADEDVAQRVAARLRERRS
jgi:hypothetical protein